MNKTQETFYFWFEKTPVGARCLGDFECDGKPNIKVVYDLKRNRIKRVEYQEGGKLIKSSIEPHPRIG